MSVLLGGVFICIGLAWHEDPWSRDTNWGWLTRVFAYGYIILGALYIGGVGW